MHVEEFIGKLEGVTRASGGHQARCPGHDDRKASLMVGQGDQGRILLKCHAGCATNDIVAAMGLTMSDLFTERAERPRVVAEYPYRDERGTHLYTAIRYDPKDFRQRLANGSWKLGDVRRVLFRLPELIAAPADAPVFVPEGEKDVENLVKLGLVATTSAGGAGKWRPEYNATLIGRRVVVLPDNDEPGRQHGRQVAQALQGVAASVTVLELPNLPPKGDVSDWLRAGGTAEQLVRLAQEAHARPLPGPRTAVSTAGGPTQPPRPFDAAAGKLEREERIQMGRLALTFGVRFLDEALGGITPRDLVLVGAKTGVGKTQLATLTALANCADGKRVHMFALEAERLEIERRMKWQILADLYYSDGGRRPIRFLDWYMGRLDDVLGGYEDDADQMLTRRLANLTVHYGGEGFSADHFCDELERVKGETDLVILDHLHYVDLPDENENRGYKRAVKQIRNSALSAGKPVIVVAHVRKGDRRYETLVPTVEDFHGSSDTPKIATKAVMLAAADAVPQAATYLWATYVQVSKCRSDSSVTRFTAQLTFNARTNRYEDHYCLGRLTDAGKAFSELPLAEVPFWARSCANTGAGQAEPETSTEPRSTWVK